MKYIFYKLLFLSLVLISCERRPLTYDYNDTLIVDINIDWQNLSKDGELPKYLKAMFYPVDGGVVVERYLESLGGELRIPQNEYNILIYTWRINAGAQSVQYRNIKSFTTIEAFTGETSKSKEKSKINGETIILQPDNYLFSWTSYDEPLDLTKKSLEALTKVPTGITSTVLKHEINAIMVNKTKVELQGSKVAQLPKRWPYHQEIASSIPGDATAIRSQESKRVLLPPSLNAMLVSAGIC